MIKGVLFDYNGTLYKDSAYNFDSWKQLVAEFSNNTIDFEPFYYKFKSVFNKYVIEDLFIKMNMPYTDELVSKWSRYKEELYRKICVDSKDNNLTKGAEKLFDYLISKNIPINICTASIIENVEFYYSFLKLDRWFDIKKCVYDDGTYIDKKQMYIDCAKKLNLDIKDCLVIEDSPLSIKLAIDAGCKNIVAIKRDDNPNYKEIKQIITNFEELDYNIFN